MTLILSSVPGPAAILHVDDEGANGDFGDLRLSDEDLAAFVDGLASAGSAAAWNEHLDSCASCTNRLIEKKAELHRQGHPGRMTVPFARHPSER